MNQHLRFFDEAAAEIEHEEVPFLCRLQPGYWRQRLRK
jgi:hypothetical protein